LAPEALTTAAHRLISLLTKAPNCGPVTLGNSAPLLAQLALISSVADSFFDFVQHARHHIGGRATRGPHAIPSSHGVIRQSEFRRAGHVRKRGISFAARHHQSLDAPCLDVLGRGAQAIEHHVHIARDQVLQGRAGAAVRNVGDEGLGLQLEQFTRQVMRGSATGRTKIEAARALANSVHEGLEIAGQVLGVHHQDLGHGGHEGQRNEVFFEVVVQLGVHGRGNGMVYCAHEIVVAIGRRLGRDTRPQVAARAAPVVNHELLARDSGELGRERAGKRVGSTAGRERHHQIDRFVGPTGFSLRPHHLRCNSESSPFQDRTSLKIAHGCLLLFDKILPWVPLLANCGLGNPSRPSP